MTHVWRNRLPQPGRVPPPAVRAVVILGALLPAVGHLSGDPWRFLDGALHLGFILPIILVSFYADLTGAVRGAFLAFFAHTTMLLAVKGTAIEGRPHWWAVEGLVFGITVLMVGAVVELLLRIHRRHTRESNDLEAFSRRLLATLDARGVEQTIASQAGQLVGADGVGIAILGHGDVLVPSTVNTGPLAPAVGRSLPLHGSLEGWCVETGQSALVNNAERDARVCLPELKTGVAHHVIAAPLEVGGKRFGTICAARAGSRAQPFRPRDLRVWSRMAHIAALAWSNASLYYESTLARRRFLEQLRELAASLARTPDPQRILDTVTERAARMLGADAATIALVDGQDIVYQARYGPGQFVRGFRLPATDSLAGTVIREGKPVRIADASQDPRFNVLDLETGSRALLAVPVVVDGRALGSLAVLQYAVRPFTDSEEELLQIVADTAASLLRNARAFEEVQRSHRRFLSLFRAIPEGALLVARDGTIELANPAAERLFGAECDSVGGATLDDFVPDAAALCDWLFTHGSAGGSCLGRLRRPDGDVREVEWRVNSVEGETSEHVVCAIRDRTEELKQTAQLRTLAAAVGAMRDGVTLADHAGMIAFVNHAAARMHGYAHAADLIGQPIELLVPEDGRQEFAALLPRMRDEGWSGETRARHRDGRSFPVQLAVAPIHLDEEHVGTVGVIADLTERRTIEQRAAASDKLATLGRLVAGTAHEINNPLGAVLANAQLTLDQTHPSDPIYGSLETIVSESRRAARIVKDMLSFARQDPVARRSFDLRETITQVLRLRTGYHHGLGIKVQVQLPQTEACVLGDPDQIRQVLLNLVVNAEHVVRSLPEKLLRLSLGASSLGWRVAVEDGGSGVPLELRARVFEPFFTTKPEGEGTGLGLSVSYGIVREHGGQIWVEESDLGGAKFLFELPANCAPAKAASPTPPRSESASPRLALAPAAHKRILVVDDEEALRSVAKRILQRHGHEVHLAADGQAALTLLGAFTYDVVLCDVRMPTLSGPELYRELQRRDASVISRFVLTTGDIADPETHRFTTETQVPVLMKPFEVQSLLQAVAA